MRVSMSYITTTTSVSRLRAESDERGVGPHTLDLLGYQPATRKLYYLEHFEDESGDLPQLHVIHTAGRHVGRATPVRSWYQGEPGDVEGRFEERLADLRRVLVPLRPMDPESMVLRTRVTKRRALRLFPQEPPIRKYELRLSVLPADDGRITSIGATTTVTAFLRPRAHLIEAARIPREPLAIAVVEYVGIPFELGFAKSVAMLVPMV